LITIGILEPLAGDVIIDLIHQKIETEVLEITKENFGEHQVSTLEKVSYDYFIILQSII
jgi:hypothetical protein